MGESATPKTSTSLILHLEIDGKRLKEQGKDYRWPRPRRCPACGGRRLWGHGYVERFFDGCAGPLWMKRYRCPECGAVHTLRPTACWRGFWAPWALIVVSLLSKLKRGRWLEAVSRQRQQYWWRGLRRQLAIEGSPAVPNGRAASKQMKVLLRRLVILATHSTNYRRMHRVRGDPYLIFAVMPAADPG